MAKNVLTYQCKKQLDERLNEVLVPIDEENTAFTYKSGYSDAVVAAELPFDCTEYNVSGFRAANIGPLAVKQVSRSEISEQIRDLTLRVAILESERQRNV